MTSPVWGIGDEVTAAKLNSRPYCHVIQSTSQNITTFGTGGWQAITFNAEITDPYSFHNNSTNNSRITPTIAGFYDVIAMAALAGNTTGDRGVQIRKNGAVVSGAPYHSISSLKTTSTFASTPWGFGTLSMNGTTDYMELYVAQDSGSTLATQVSASFTRSYMRAMWVAPL